MYATRESSSTYEPVPSGAHHAVCVSVIDLGTQESEYQGRTKHQRKINIGWELPNEMGEEWEDDQGVKHPAQPRMISKKYTLSFHEKARLLKDLNSWRGRPFTEEELSGPPDGFHLSALLGVNCQLSVVHNQSQDGSRTYSNVEAIMPLLKGTPKLENTRKTTYLDLSEFDEAVFNELPEYLQDLVKKSPEYDALNGPASGGVYRPGEDDGGPEGNFDLDDEIPFNLAVAAKSARKGAAIASAASYCEAA